VILRCFVVRIWLRLDSNRALRDFLAMDYYPHNRRIMKACGLTSLPDSNCRLFTSHIIHTLLFFSSSLACLPKFTTWLGVKAVKAAVAPETESEDLKLNLKNLIFIVEFMAKIQLK
jgi:hypothetical protein